MKNDAASRFPLFKYHWSAALLESHDLFPFVENGKCDLECHSICFFFLFKADVRRKFYFCILSAETDKISL